LDYLDELGVTYLHLMPLLEPRPGENDGGYAVQDYRAVDPRLDSMADLAEPAGRLHEREMSLCVDLVLNHTAMEHPWARGWRSGDPYLGGHDRYRRSASWRTTTS
jgi:amylosucrase